MIATVNKMLMYGKVVGISEFEMPADRRPSVLKIVSMEIITRYQTKDRIKEKASIIDLYAWRTISDKVQVGDMTAADVEPVRYKFLDRSFLQVFEFYKGAFEIEPLPEYVPKEKILKDKKAEISAETKARRADKLRELMGSESYSKIGLFKIFRHNFPWGPRNRQKNFEEFMEKGVIVYDEESKKYFVNVTDNLPY